MTVSVIGPHSQLGRKMKRRLKEKEIVFNGYGALASDIFSKVSQVGILNEEIYDAGSNCSACTNADSVKSVSHIRSAALAQRISNASKEYFWGTY